MRVLVLPSPLLGAEGWAETCELLAAGGHEVDVVTPHPPLRVSEVMAGFAARLGREACVLVGHSNAGNYLPGLLASAPDGTRAIFVDCEVPPRTGTIGAMTGQRLELLRSMADESGALPPWPQWWDAPTWAGLVPDAPSRDRIFTLALRSRLAYFEEAVALPARWWKGAYAYLRFQESLEPEANKAAKYGWPVRRLRGTHLHMVNDPRQTASALSGLIDELLG